MQSRSSFLCPPPPLPLAKLPMISHSISKLSAAKGKPANGMRFDVALSQLPKKGNIMIKHRGFPGRLTGTDHQYVIRRANVKEGATKLVVRERFRDRKATDKAADKGFLTAIWHHFGEEPFERGNLDAGRLSWFFMREILPAEEPFDPASYEAMLKLNLKIATVSFPEVFAADAPEPIWDDEYED